MPYNVVYRYCPVCGQEYEAGQIQNFAHQCSHCGFILYENANTTASGVIISDNQLLLIKRAHNPKIDRWDFPGGFVEPKEHPERAVVREIKEELSVDSEVERLFGVYGPTEYLYQNKLRYNCDLYYLIKLKNTQLSPGDDAKAFRWFNKSELEELDKIAFESQVPLVKDICQQLLV